VYRVEALTVQDSGSYSTVVQPPPPPPPPPTGWVQVWRGDGKFNEWTYPFDGGDHNPQNNGAGQVFEEILNGVPCIRHYGPSSGSNTRVFQMPQTNGQWGWPNQELLFQSNYLIPSLVTGNWNCFQFKSKEIGQSQSRNEPFFSFNLWQESGKYRLRIYHKPDGDPDSATLLPELPAQPRVNVGEWFTIKARLVQSELGTHKGEVDVWLNDVQTHQIRGVDTKYVGASTQTWSVNLYGSNISRPATQYTTAHIVSRRG
jgi:hypothetical protein